MIDGEVVKGLLIFILGVIVLCLAFHHFGGKKMKKPVFEIFNDKKGEFRFRMKAPNGEIVLQSEGYVSKQGCVDTVEAIKKYASVAIIEDVTK
jgi:uncharacterized protein YegP (UPF0339 family)